MPISALAGGVGQVAKKDHTGTGYFASFPGCHFFEINFVGCAPLISYFKFLKSWSYHFLNLF